jgi:hypothetical protein
MRRRLYGKKKTNKLHYRDLTCEHPLAIEQREEITLGRVKDIQTQLTTY